MTAATVVGAAVAGWTRTAALYVSGFGLAAAVVATSVAIAYRKASLRPLPVGAGILSGVALPVVWLTLRVFRGVPLVGTGGVSPEAAAAYVVVVVLSGGIAAEAGRRVGDHLACEVYDVTRLDGGGEATELVRSAGHAVGIDLPESVEDATGYPAVEDRIKRELAGRTLLFPSRLTPDDRRSRLVSRIEEDYGIGYVDVETDRDGDVSRLVVGGRRRGIGCSLPPNTVAVAVRTGPSPEVDVGDPVEVWDTRGRPNELVATGTVRSSSDGVSTVVVDAEAAEGFESGTTYRLVARPDEPDDRYELVAAIREADETVLALAVETDGPLEGEFVDWLPAAVPVIERDGEAVPFPPERETLRAGDTAYVFGTPAEIRDLAAYERDRQRAIDVGTVPGPD